MNKKGLISFLIGSAVMVILVFIAVFASIGTKASDPGKTDISEGSIQTAPVSAIETTDAENTPSSSEKDINSTSSEKDVRLNEDEPDTTESAIPKYYYDVNKAGIGDIVGGMKIKELMNSGDAVDSGNLEFLITFEGEFEVTGTFSILEMTEEYCFYDDTYISDFLPFSSLEADIEKNKYDKLKVFFYIINEDDLHNEISKFYDNYEKGQPVNINVIFSEYSFCVYGFNFEHWVKFDELLEVY